MRTVAIIGKAPSVSAIAPSVERWGCNDLPAQRDEGWAFDAWDRWFDVHTEGHIRKHRPAAWDWYRTRGSVRPIYLLTATPVIPGSRPYPFATIQAAFAWGGGVEEFFTSSVDYMLALAIHERVDRIALHGVDLWAASHERGTQRNGAHYWIGIARGRGIEVVIPDHSSLCKIERMYGCFTLTSPRNFSSVSVGRFLQQVAEAQAMAAPGYVAPGLDEVPLVVHG